MRLTVAAAFVAALASCTSGGVGPAERSTDSPEPWKEMANRHPGRFAPRLYLAYDAAARQNWGEFDRLSRLLEEQAEDEANLAGPLGTLFLAAGRSAPSGHSTPYLEKARHSLERASREPGSDAELPFSLGATCFLLRDFAAASASLQQSLEREPGNPAAVALLVRSLLEQGEPASALGWIEKAHGSIAPAERHELVALCHYMMGQHAQAIRSYEAALDADSANPRLWHNLGLCYEESRQADKARECFARAESLRHPAPDRR